MDKARKEGDGPITAGCVMTPAPRTLLERLFPARYLPPCDWNNPEPGYAPGEFSTIAIVVLDWRDRLRMLVSGRLHIEIRTATDRMVGLAKSRSVAYVMPPAKQEKQRFTAEGT